jgi:hypothetical protein
MTAVQSIGRDWTSAGDVERKDRNMKTYQDGAYAMAALSASVVAIRILVKKGLVTREEAARAIVDEAVQRAIFAESKQHDELAGQTTAELNRQSAEILKIIAESL